MTLITDTLIFRETLSVPSIVPVNGSQQYSNKYLVVEVTGGESETTPYPGITLEQIFVNNAQGLVGASLPLRIGKQLIEVMPFGLYKIRLIAQGGIVRATVKIWENTGVLYNYATETPATPDNNAGNITGAEIRNRLVDLVSPNRLPLSAIEGAENLGQNLQITWENLTGKPTTFPPISHNHPWSQITDKPSFATVATSGDYNDLINKPAGETGGGREVLQADRTYFVRTDGNDNNNGLTNTAGGAFATPIKAGDVAASLDWSIYNVDIIIQSGTYVFSSPWILKRGLGEGKLTIQGSTSTATDCTIRGENLTFIKGVGLSNIEFKNLQIDTIDSNSAYINGILLSGCIAKLNNVAFKGSNLAIGLISSNSFVEAEKISMSGAFYVGLSFDFGSTLKYLDGSTFNQSATFNYACLQLDNSGCRFFNITISGSASVAMSVFSWLVQKSGKTFSQVAVTDSIVKTF